MQIVLHALGFSLTDTIRRHAEHRFRSALTCYDEHIRGVVIRLSDHSGNRTGSNKCCHAQVRLAGLADVVVDDFDVNLYVAMGRAAHRANRTVKRRLARRRDKMRSNRLRDSVQPDDPVEKTRTHG